jgi:hypothetical protein
MVSFTVALNMRNVEEMKQEFMDVSMPTSAKYGQFLTLDDVASRYGPTRQDRESVVQFFQTIDGSTVTGLNHKGDMLTVTASVAAIEERLYTKLSYRKDKHNRATRYAVRCDEPLEIPEDIKSLISFISLNAPVTQVYPRAGKALKSQQQTLQAGIASEDPSAAQTIGVTAGNTEALLSFVPYCGDGSRNVASPPCSNVAAGNQISSFSVSVSAYNNDLDNQFALNNSPLTFNVATESVYCYDSKTSAACTGADTATCSCLLKVSSLPKYQQLKATVSSVNSQQQSTVLGSSSLFALTDVATAAVLNDLYSIPAGVKAHPSSNQSVVEFYSEVGLCSFEVQICQYYCVYLYSSTATVT